MKIVKPSRIRAYMKDVPDAAKPLGSWLIIASREEWNSIRDVRRSYPHADAVKTASGRTVTVFNIGGNKYRLIVAIKYQWSVLCVLRFMTHAEYDKDQWKEQL